MPLVVKFSSGSGDLVEEGEYLAVLESVTDVTERLSKGGGGFTQQDGSPKPTVELAFRVIEGERTDSLVTALASLYLTKRSKLYEFIQGFGVVPESLDNGIDLESLIGRTVRVYVENEDKGNGLRSKVTKVKQPRVEGETENTEAQTQQAAAPVQARTAPAPRATPRPAPVARPAVAPTATATTVRPAPATAATAPSARPPFGFPAKRNPLFPGK